MLKLPKVAIWAVSKMSCLQFLTVFTYYLVKKLCYYMEIGSKQRLLVN